MRTAFRLVFCYFMLYALCSGFLTLWDTIPYIGSRIAGLLATPFLQGAQWSNTHLIHAEPAGTSLGADSGDGALNWLSVGVMLLLAIVGSFLWSIFDRRREGHAVLSMWLRFILRLTVAGAMAAYGLDKIFLSQMPPPSLAVLNEPLGSTSPMMLLWTTIGSKPGYQIATGLVELAAALLLFLRRTALLGAICTVFIMSNVVLYDYFFNVGVKIYAAHLLLMALVLVAPDLKSLVSYFWSHKPTYPRDGWTPRVASRGPQIAILAFELAVLVSSVGYRSYSEMRDRRTLKQQATNVAPFAGQWHVQSSELAGRASPLVLQDQSLVTDLFIEPFGALNVRTSSGALLDGDVHFNEAKRNVRLDIGLSDHPIVYTLAQPDPTHLLLTPKGADSDSQPTLSLVRVTLPAHYPLLDNRPRMVIDHMDLR